MTDAHADYGDECPECGAFYQLTTRAPTPPAMLLEHGTDYEIDQWDAEHDYNIVECLACGWRSDEDL